GQGKGVDAVGIENGDVVGLFLVVKHRRQTPDNGGDPPLQLRIRIFAAIGGQNARMLCPGEGGHAVVASDRIYGNRVARRLESLLVEGIRAELAAGEREDKRQACPAQGRGSRSGGSPVVIRDRRIPHSCLVHRPL